MKPIYLILTVAIILFFLFGFSFAKWQHWKDEARRHENNWNASIMSAQNERNGFAIQQRLTKDQFDQKYGKLIDSLNRISKENIRLNRMLSFTRIELERQRLNVKIDWKDSLINGDTIRIGRKLMFRDSCVRFDVFYPTDSSYALVSSRLRIKADLLVYRGKRMKQFRPFGIGLWRYGPRQVNAEVFTNCDSASVKVENIEIVKP